VTSRAYGVLGGTFDPVHLGHVAIARSVREGLGLEAVLLVPATLPPHKRAHEITPARHRGEMVRLALAGQDGLELCTIELDRGGVCYTIDTLDELRARRDGSPLFLLGTDALCGIHTWHAWDRLVSEYDLVAIDRPGAELRSCAERLVPGVAGRVAFLPATLAPDALRALELGRGGRVLHFPLAPIRISSSDVRRRAAAGSSLSGLVPPEVARYIQSTRIYQEVRP
jgi:nicotinate-nucleotide adenylyltransferase